MVINAKEALRVSIENTPDDGLAIAMREITFRASNGSRDALIKESALDLLTVSNLISLGYTVWTNDEGWVSITW